uniref:Cytochrome b6-f complex subunit 6 n=5 Tax=Mesangiospermae TaxID=1437183 RepID=A0A346Q3Y2_9GENT|nr:cytochrome b6/f complex subunit VI [Paederia scandens]AXR87734.1 cytochrome b6/f complex subunit VI [Paederia scandens]AXR87817.1 cytochrome b6/f complex subunit VI [Paederia scandens]AXR87901.1 cytochrome b6/f complex subunit VI [Paederia scandens]
MNQELSIGINSVNWYFFLLYLAKIEAWVNVLSAYVAKERILFSSFMPTITSYFGFLLAASTITSALLIGLNKIRLIRS